MRELLALLILITVGGAVAAACLVAIAQQPIILVCLAVGVAVVWAVITLDEAAGRKG